VTRQASVAEGLSHLGDTIDTVLIHDAARPLTPVSQFERVLQHVRATGAGAVPGLPVTDTLKHVTKKGLIVDTVDRSQLVAVQTPQGFPRDHILTAHALAQAETTDDASLVTQHGLPVDTVKGDPLAFKITTPWDLRRAEELLTCTTPAFRTGIGVDVHAFDSNRELWLAGLHWPNETGLAGHSDGDAVCHAIVDALLSASGLGDMGSVFGTADPRFTNAPSEIFLRQSMHQLSEADWIIDNIAVQIIAQQPQFSQRRTEAEKLLSGILGAPVSISATTTDGLGFTGKKEGVAVIATALIHPAK
jgi:2-C-methyl-D-erythritol 4-phosphate cytidylyltransferase/2-C-methyl-D-erythritol 2,4-cyclodiphosphate synthase